MATAETGAEENGAGESKEKEAGEEKEVREEELHQREEEEWGYTMLVEQLLDTSKFPFCVSLNLRGTIGIDPQAMATSLEQNLTLQVLNLADCRISKDGAIKIGIALRYHPSLAQLSLNRNKIGDDAALLIVSLITGT